MAKHGSVNIRPGMGILGLFPAMNYRPWYALAELVDNAIDSFLTHAHALRAAAGKDYKLRLVIEVDGTDKGLIRVWDNAAGINAQSYARAFVTAEPPKTSAGLSQFGIGMKSASCWFARRWRVTSKALGEEVERTLEFDVPQIVEEGIEEISPTTRRAKAADHFTEVRLWDLYKPPQTQTIGKMRRHLASMYRMYLRSGEVSIKFNDEEISYEEPEVLVASPHRRETEPAVKWRKELQFALPTGERVRGFAALRETGSVKYAGFALFRHRRLVVGSDDDTYRPSEVFGGSNSYRFQRLFGELCLDDFDVTHTKDSFIWGSREQQFLDALREALDAGPLRLLDQAENYRARRAGNSVVAAASTALDETARVLSEGKAVIEQLVDHAPSAENPPETHSSQALAGERVLDLTVRGKQWLVTVDLTTDQAAREWLEITDRPPPMKKSPRRLGIRLSLSHPFTQRFSGAAAEQIEVLVRMAAGLALAEVTARESGVKEAGTIRRNLNELLLAVLSRE